MEGLREVSCLVGGEQGEGIESVGDILAKAMGRLGYYLFGYRNFSSRIKGGHTDFNLRISVDRVYNISEQLEMIVAFDEETVKLHQASLVKNGIIIIDPKTVKQENLHLREDIHFIKISFSDIATGIGNALMKNMVAVGAICALLDQPLEVFEQAIREQFESKGENIVQKNLEAAKKGYEELQALVDVCYKLEHTTAKDNMFLSGNDAIALGAVLGGARFMAGYPITPASEVLENLIRILPQYGGVVVQSEDELSAIAMVIGAGYAGARALTATSGPGLSLMQEAIGLAGATEIPIVIVDCQRGGPSSGMATKFEQSDLNAMLVGTHGEAPRIILAPSTVEEALLDLPKAFNLAEEFQCPVIVAADLLLSTSRQSCPMIDYEQIEIKRGRLVSQEELLVSEDPVFKRYAVTDDGISLRSIPGQEKGMHHVTGIEHGPTGHPSENPENRNQQMAKRMRKLDHVPLDGAIKYEGKEKPEILLVGFGSTYGPIREARLHLEQAGLHIGHAHLRMLSPLPVEQLSEYAKDASLVIVVEQNYTGQLANIIKQHLPLHEKLHNCLKYSGVPISYSEIISFTTDVMKSLKELV